MGDPTRDEDGSLAERWDCPDCSLTVHLHDDPDHPSHDWTREFVREHEYVHREHLAFHNGDRPMMQLALRWPALHAALIRVHGPVEDLTPERRAEILRPAGIDET